MSSAFLFPGQGSETPGMGGASLRSDGPVRDLLERASKALDVELAATVARGSPALATTEVSQPALVAIGIGLALELQSRGVLPDAVAGHSVGEIAAFAVAGCLSPEEAIDCVIERARLMTAAASGAPGGMAAVRVTTEAQLDGFEIAAHNSPQEWVVTGDRASLAAAAAKFPTVPLPVAGPWHSKAMADAGAKWRACLERVRWRAPKVPLVANATGIFVGPEDNPIDLLAGQLTHPVRWAKTMQTLVASGIATFHIFGPGKVLRGLCRSNAPGSKVELHDGAALEEVRA